MRIQKIVRGHLATKYVERIRLARQTQSAACLALLSDPTSLARTHPAVHGCMLNAASGAVTLGSGALQLGTSLWAQLAARAGTLREGSAASDAQQRADDRA